MKCNPLRWLWGLIPLAMLLFVALVSERGRIENDLKVRADETLRRAGLSWASTRFDVRDGTITGQAPEEGEPDKAQALVRGTWGVRAADDRSELIEKIANYSWSAELRDNKLRLSGYVPNDTVRKTVLGIAKANLPNRSVEDRMKMARGAPDRDAWLGGVNFALTQLAQMKSGQVDLEGANLSVGGVADGFPAYKSVKTALSTTVPKGVKLKVDRVTPPVVSPYTWSAQRTGERLMLAGHVPSEQIRQQIFALAKATFPRSAIVDQMEIADGAPQNFIAASRLALTQLVKLEEGHADLRATQLTVSGLAATDLIANEAKASLKSGQLDGIRVADAIRFRAVAVPTINPFVTSVDASQGTVVLDGWAPSEEARVALGETAKARLPGRRIDNRVKVANGAPQSWQACIQAGLASLGRLSNGSLAMSESRIEIAGETMDETLFGSLGDDLKRLSGGGCAVANRIVLKDAPEPALKWSATHAQGRVVLEGRVPDAASKASLAQAAERLYPGNRVEDRTAVANVPPKRWTSVALEGLEQLATLAVGSARIDGTELTVSGEATAARQVDDVRSRLAQRLPKGYTGRDVISVRQVAADPALDQRRQREQAEARRAEEDARRKAEADAERRRQDDARRQAEADAERKRQEAAALDARNRAEAQRCQTAIRTAAAAGSILFQRASAELDQRSLPTIQALAKAANECPAMRIEIEGHTDAEGTAERNKGLSERRAQSVLARLKAAGVGDGRMQAFGFGAEKPVAPNDTPDNRARNRRIEFNVRAQ